MAGGLRFTVPVMALATLWCVAVGGVVGPACPQMFCTSEGTGEWEGDVASLPNLKVWTANVSAFMTTPTTQMACSSNAGVVACFVPESSTIVSFNASDGNLLWHQYLSSPGEPGSDPLAPLVSVDASVVLSTSTYFYRFDHLGQTMWDAIAPPTPEWAPGTSFSPGLLSSRAIVFSSEWGLFAVYANGTPISAFKLTTMASDGSFIVWTIRSRPVTVPLANGEPEQTGRAFAVATADGHGVRLFAVDRETNIARRMVVAWSVPLPVSLESPTFFSNPIILPQPGGSPVNVSVVVSVSNSSSVTELVSVKDDGSSGSVMWSSLVGCRGASSSSSSSSMSCPTSQLSATTASRVGDGSPHVVVSFPNASASCALVNGISGALVSTFAFSSSSPALVAGPVAVVESKTSGDVSVLAPLTSPDGEHSMLGVYSVSRKALVGSVPIPNPLTGQLVPGPAASSTVVVSDTTGQLIALTAGK